MQITQTKIDRFTIGDRDRMRFLESLFMCVSTVKDCCLYDQKYPYNFFACFIGKLDISYVEI